MPYFLFSLISWNKKNSPYLNPVVPQSRCGQGESLRRDKAAAAATLQVRDIDHPTRVKHSTKEERGGEEKELLPRKSREDQTRAPKLVARKPSLPSFSRERAESCTEVAESLLAECQHVTRRRKEREQRREAPVAGVRLASFPHQLRLRLRCLLSRGRKCKHSLMDAP